MKWTEGDWEVKYEFNVMVGNRAIASCGGHSNNKDNEKVREENMANAMLCSASPEMYDALRKVLSLVELGVEVENADNSGQTYLILRERDLFLEVMSDVRSALAKADSDYGE